MVQQERLLWLYIPPPPGLAECAVADFGDSSLSLCLPNCPCITKTEKGNIVRKCETFSPSFWLHHELVSGKIDTQPLRSALKGKKAGPVTWPSLTSNLIFNFNIILVYDNRTLYKSPRFRLDHHGNQSFIWIMNHQPATHLVCLQNWNTSKVMMSPFYIYYPLRRE